MKENDSVAILNFDETLKQQSFLTEKHYEWIDLTDLTGVSKLCEEASLKEIAKRLSKRKNRPITLIGSGDYHYVTYLLLKEISIPFSLILFDNHPDYQKPLFSDYISCGSWVLEALEKLHLLEHVIIIGPPQQELNHPLDNFSDKISLFPIESFLSLPRQTILQQIIQHIPTTTVYISIDKDVLDQRDAVTNWDHGRLRLTTLLHLLHSLSGYKKFIGGDICGEYSFSPFQHINNKIKEIITLNSKANKVLIDRFMSAMKKEETVHFA